MAVMLTVEGTFYFKIILLYFITLDSIASSLVFFFKRYTFGLSIMHIIYILLAINLSNFLKNM